MIKFNKGHSFYTALAISLFFLAIRLSSPPTNILSYDVFGYYLYLPATFIYDDPAIQDIGWVQQVNEKYGNTPTLYQVAKTQDGNFVIRFYSGIAIMFSPFFFAGHAVALLTPYDADGFSSPYQWAIILAGIFYTLSAVWFLRRALLSNFTEATTAITLALIFIGSNVLFFSAWGNDAPHIYILALFSVVLWLTTKWYARPGAGYAVALGLVTGITAITRPSDAFIVLVPLLYGLWNVGSLKDKLLLIWRNKRDVILIVLFAIIGFLPQLLYWKFASGDWVYNSYDDPQSGFDFGQPRIAYVLFGFRKGLYVYSTMMLFATLGIIFLIRQKKEWFTPVLVFFLANVYLISCYSSLIAFGWRAFIEMHAVMALPLAALVAWSLERKRTARTILMALLFATLALNIFKVWQLKAGIIDGSRMTREYYFDSFFTTSLEKVNTDLLLVRRSVESIEHLENEEDFDHRILAFRDFENDDDPNTSLRDTSFAHSGKYSIRLHSGNAFSSPIKIPFNEITRNYYAWIRASMWVYRTDDTATDESLLIIHFDYKGRPYKFRGVSFKNQGLEFTPGQWNLISIDYMTPEVRTPRDPLMVYAWYRGEGDIHIDDILVEVFEPRTITSE